MPGPSPKFINLTGRRFGKLTVLEQWERRRSQNGDGRVRTWWKVICDCGNEDWVQVNVLQSGHKRSCSCLWFKDALPGGEGDMRARFRSYKAGQQREISTGNCPLSCFKT